VGSRRARLRQMADSGRTGAQEAMALSADPTRFLSTVQVGITSIGILSGAIGEAAIAGRLRLMFESMPLVAPYANALSLAIMVVGLTYVSLIVGELVPKRLALTRPEVIASLISRPMQWLAGIARPLIVVLSASTAGILRLFRVRPSSVPALPHAATKLLMDPGTVGRVVDAAV